MVCGKESARGSAVPMVLCPRRHHLLITVGGGLDAATSRLPQAP